VTGEKGSYKFPFKPPEGWGRPFPSGSIVRQTFAGPQIENVEAAVISRLENSAIEEKIKPGMTVAVGVGSRGIACLPELVSATVRFLKDKGARPIIIPAMGSHGGATEEGQERLLADYGITETSVGAALDTSMEVDEIGHTPGGVPVLFSRSALKADAVIPVCRIKPHTSFRGPYESGVLKMLAIGFGKHRGAAVAHAEGFAAFAKLIPEMGRIVLDTVPVLGAVTTIENARERPAQIDFLRREEIMDREPELLERARAWMGRILFDEFDLLIVDEIGKDISGDGMDPNVIGRYSQPFLSAPPRIQKIVVLDLTAETSGNACGIGLADVTTQTVFDKLDFVQTYTNVVTSTVLKMAKLPLVLPDTESAIAVGLGACNGTVPEEARVVRIKNTLDLEYIWVSDSLLQQSAGRPEITILEPAALLDFPAYKKTLDETKFV